MIIPFKNSGLQDAKFSKVPGVLSTRVGYTGGSKPDPTYNSVCSGDGHTEAVKVDFDPQEVPYEDLLKVCTMISLRRFKHVRDLSVADADST